MVVSGGARALGKNKAEGSGGVGAIVSGFPRTLSTEIPNSSSLHFHFQVMGDSVFPLHLQWQDTYFSRCNGRGPGNTFFFPLPCSPSPQAHPILS